MPTFVSSQGHSQGSIEGVSTMFSPVLYFDMYGHLAGEGRTVVLKPQIKLWTHFLRVKYVRCGEPYVIL